MADKISATITYVDTANNKGTKAITDISPTADNRAIKNFCVGLLGLTTNTLSQIDRVEKTDITNATAKPKLTLTLHNDTIDAKTNDVSLYGQLFTQAVTADFTYKLTANDAGADHFALNLEKNPNNTIQFQTVVSDENGGKVTYQIYFEETETTAATTAQILFSTSSPVLTIL